MQKICIVIPCYNEENRFPLKEFEDGYKNTNFYFLFVNDGSKDLTINVLNNFREGREDRVFVLNQLQNGGKSEAVRAGMLAASKISDFEIVGYLDADLATPLNEVKNITDKIGDNILFAFGSRIKRLGANVSRKWYRHILGRIFATFASLLLKLGIYDTQCGAKFFHKSIVEIAFSHKFETNWIFDVEIFFRLKKFYKNINISDIAKEVPLQYWVDVEGSKIKISHLFKIPFDLLKLKKHYS